MSGPIDETFTEQQLIPGTVLEFGCNPGHFTARMAARPDLTVTAIDLYGSDTTEGFRFIKGDLMDLEFFEQFDNVCCVSSFEHAGIERYEFDRGAVNLDYHRLVAAKLVSLVKPGGRLIVTCPFGPDEVWFTDGQGHNFKADEPGNPKWGFRTFTLETLKALFAPLVLVRASACELRSEDYFTLSEWYRIDAEKDHTKFTGTRANYGVIGVVFGHRG
jgi:SAM-dependent methyltransferase